MRALFVLRLPPHRLALEVVGSRWPRQAQRTRGARSPSVLSPPLDFCNALFVTCMVASCTSHNRLSLSLSINGSLYSLHMIVTRALCTFVNTTLIANVIVLIAL